MKITIVNTRYTRRDAAPNNKKVIVKKKKVGQTRQSPPKITTPPPDPSSAKEDKATEKNRVIIHCTYEGKVYELIGFCDKAVNTVYLLLKECLLKENAKELDDLPETADGLSYVSEGKRVSRHKNLGAFLMKIDMSIDNIAEKTSTLGIVGPEPSYYG